MAFLSSGGGRSLEDGGAWVAVTHHLPPPGAAIEVDLGAMSCRAEIRDENGELVWVFDPATRLPRSPVFGCGRASNVRVRRWRLLGSRRAPDPVAV